MHLCPTFARTLSGLTDFAGSWMLRKFPTGGIGRTSVLAMLGSLRYAKRSERGHLHSWLASRKIRERVNART